VQFSAFSAVCPYEIGDMVKDTEGKVYTITHEDCMALMARYPEKHFDLAIVDPPYGIGEDWKKRNKGSKFAETTYKNKNIPTRDYFSELFRVSKNQIIWGYNYFTDILGPTNYLIVWDKMSSNNKVTSVQNKQPVILQNQVGLL